MKKLNYKCVLVMTYRQLKFEAGMTELSLNWNQVQNELKGFVFKRVRDKALTEDIVHDVFLKVQNKIQQVRETEKLFGWIYQITRNTIIDHYRKNKKQISLKDIDWESSPANFNDCVSNVINELIPTLPDTVSDSTRDERTSKHVSVGSSRKTRASPTLQQSREYKERGNC